MTTVEPVRFFSTSPLQMPLSGCAFSTSPLSTHNSHDGASRGISPRAIPSSRGAGYPSFMHTRPQLEPLTFNKISVPSSTDSEAPSDYAEPSSRQLSRSPSLLTCLIQSQSRISSAASSAYPTPVTPALVTPTHISLLPRTKPILRRASTSTNTSDDGGCWSRPAAALAHALRAVPESTRERDGTCARSRRSCLKFAVTPCVPQPPSEASSRRPSPRATTPSLALDEEDVEEEVTNITFEASDSDDAGYQEDSEDGFESDNEPSIALASPRGRPMWNPTPAPILATPRRRATAPVPELPCPSTTDDCGSRPPRARRIRIRVSQDMDNGDRCTRHRSPPPTARPILARSPSPAPAPPAARSPSAFELCRRRSGIPRVPSERCTEPRTRGWRSDDCAFRGPTTAPRKGSLAPPTARRGRHTPSAIPMERDGEVTPPCVEAPNRALHIARRGSAPARVNEVNATAWVPRSIMTRGELQLALQAAVEQGDGRRRDSR